MGTFIAVLIILLWAGHLTYALSSVSIDFTSIQFYAAILVQTYLYTGLFITAHDAMHLNISGNKKLNYMIGKAASFLYAGLSYKKLLKNHKLHHTAPGTESDPDFSPSTQNFLLWWLTFLFRYTTVPQLIYMGIIFNILKTWIQESNLWYFWVIPAVLSSAQLFYYGTYKPHMLPHINEMKPHNARTQNKNHLIAMITCYFFGYHYEHHSSPGTPWWRLYKLK